MEIVFKIAEESEKDTFVKFGLMLREFNRQNHNEQNKYDNFEEIKKQVTLSLSKTFEARNLNTFIQFAYLNNQPVGYVLAKIYEEDSEADNGTGKMGLLDEIFVHDSARGHGIGQKLIDNAICWLKENNIHRVKLHAFSWNKGAKKLYEKNSFAEYAVSYEKFI